MKGNFRQANHLLWRSGFGPSAEQIQWADSIPLNDQWQQQIALNTNKPLIPIEVTTIATEMEMAGIVPITTLQAKTEEEKRNALKQQLKNSRATIKKLNLQWLEEMANSPQQLREKMALFWHGHFACRSQNGYFQQQILSIIRTHALGNFATLLREVSKSAAMLQFLNNQQNRKQKPNENFAREVMELFTMGRGNYTENDIKEAARAFTGWGFDVRGQFVFRKQFHDENMKTIFGKTGNFEGDDVIDFLLQQPQTAQFIVTKLYRFLVNDTPHQKHIQWLSKRFSSQHQYEILPLLSDIFTSDWFFAQENMGNHIKSPIELWVGIRRMLQLTTANDEFPLLIQKLLGQVLLYPPNVAGWPGGTNWIDSSTLLVRMRLPQMLAIDEKIQAKLKADDDNEMGRMEAINQLNRYSPSAKMNMAALQLAFEPIARPQLINGIAKQLLQTKNIPTVKTLEKNADASQRNSFIQSVAFAIMSTPEYQLS